MSFFRIVPHRLQHIGEPDLTQLGILLEPLHQPVF
jgi:hypothetical protein